MYDTTRIDLKSEDNAYGGVVTVRMSFSDVLQAIDDAATDNAAFVLLGRAPNVVGLAVSEILALRPGNRV